MKLTLLLFPFYRWKKQKHWGIISNSPRSHSCEMTGPGFEWRQVGSRFCHFPTPLCCQISISVSTVWSNTSSLQLGTGWCWWGEWIWLWPWVKVEPTGFVVRWHVGWKQKRGVTFCFCFNLSSWTNGVAFNWGRETGRRKENKSLVMLCGIPIIHLNCYGGEPGRNWGHESLKYLLSGIELISESGLNPLSVSFFPSVLLNMSPFARWGMESKTTVTCHLYITGTIRC